jgi:hypothetical protein
MWRRLTAIGTDTPSTQSRNGCNPRLLVNEREGRRSCCRNAALGAAANQPDHDSIAFTSTMHCQGRTTVIDVLVAPPASL